MPFRTLLLAAMFAAFAGNARAGVTTSSFLAFPDAATATARSVAEGVALGVQGGSPWWATITLTCGVYLVFEAAPRDAVYDFTTNPGGSTGLTANERAQLLSYTQMQANGCFVNNP